jgi:uroporphyrinogen-III synthase
VVLVTRPAGQVVPLCRAVEALGGEALSVPTIEIAVVPEAAARVHEAVGAGFDIAVFTSANAARIAWPMLAAAAPAPVAAVGEGTAAALRELGAGEVHVPVASADSEGLLALPLLSAPAGRSVAIFTGEDGRAVLAEGLAARGTRVRIVPVYRRVLPPPPHSALVGRILGGCVHAVTVSSAEGGRNLYALLPANAAAVVARLPHVAPHARVAAALRSAGVSTVLVAPGGDGALAAALGAHFAAAPAGAGR